MLNLGCKSCGYRYLVKYLQPCPDCGSRSIIARNEDDAFIYAGPMERTFAFIVDLGLMMVLIPVVALFVVAGLKAAESFVPEWVQGLIFLGFILAFYSLYTAFLDSSPLMGTVGKRLNRIHVCNYRGERVSFLQALFRSWLRLFAFSGFVFGVPAGWIVLAVSALGMLFVPHRQCLHDWLTGSLSILNHSGEKLDLYFAEPRLNQEAPAQSSPQQSGLAINLASEEEIALLEGVGPILAQRIVRVRDSLGGFHSFAHLQEAAMIPSHLAERLQELITVTPLIDLNSASSAEIAEGLGLSKGKAALLVRQRQAQFGFKSLDEVNQILQLNAKALEQLKQQATLRPYQAEKTGHRLVDT